MNDTHSGSTRSRRRVSDLALVHDDSDGSHGESTQRSTRTSAARSSRRSEGRNTLRRVADKLGRQNKQLKAELDGERRKVRQTEAVLEREERAIRELRLELEELKSHDCPVCQAQVPHEEIDRHMEACLHRLTLHVTEQVRRANAVELALYTEDAQRDTHRLRGSPARPANQSPSPHPNRPVQTWVNPIDIDPSVADKQDSDSSNGRGMLATGAVVDVRRTSRSSQAGRRSRAQMRPEATPYWQPRRASYSPPREHPWGDSLQPPRDHAMTVRDHFGSLPCTSSKKHKHDGRTPLLIIESFFVESFFIAAGWSARACSVA